MTKCMMLGLGRSGHADRVSPVGIQTSSKGALWKGLTATCSIQALKAV